MPNLLDRLPADERRGSRPRCVLLTHGPVAEVAQRLTALVSPHARVESNRHVWQPKGWADPTEAKLGETAPFLSSEHRQIITDWWLAVRGGANTPNWDIVSQATIEGREGLILVEAKAHHKELKSEGKRPRNPANHKRIVTAIREANDTVAGVLPGWHLSADSHYQLANRFAWTWKIASLGMPVILVYLGFLQAEEMRDQGEPFADQNAWADALRTHAKGIIPDAAWEGRIPVQGTLMRAMIRSLRLDLPMDSRS
jgi:hypothetical protein